MKDLKGLKRVLLKLSGEALAGEKKTGFDEETVLKVAEQVKQIVDDGVQVAIVIGGGNFWRGRTSENMERTKADQIGMLATVMNCIYVSDMFRHTGMKTKVYTPFTCGAFTELFSKDDAVNNLEDGVVTFFAGGTGHPYFSTDTATVLRAVEIGADAILLAKAVDGIYDSDPKVNPDAKKYDEISIDEVVAKKLAAMDLTASIMCMENHVPMAVFSLNEKDGIVTMSGSIEDDTVTFSVSDDGVGIPDISRAREPLFTGKPEMERSGMGFTIMETFMDSIEVQSEVGKGTRITMTKKLK